VASGPLFVRGRRGNTGQTPHPILARARGHFRIPTRFPPRRRHSHPCAATGNRIFRRILFYGVRIRGLLARTNFRPVKSEYRIFYSRFTDRKIGNLLDMLLQHGLALDTDSYFYFVLQEFRVPHGFLQRTLTGSKREATRAAGERGAAASRRRQRRASATSHGQQ
jgi:hypothetical protein